MSLKNLCKKIKQVVRYDIMTPQASTSPSILSLAREVFETGALVSIRAKDPAGFTRAHMIQRHAISHALVISTSAAVPSSERRAGYYEVAIGLSYSHSQSFMYICM